jgi:glycerol-3-phosphate dehydrogenase (NAD(P)+)
MTARRAGRRTTLWVRERHVAEAIAQSRRNPFLPQYPLSPAITATDNLRAALRGARLVLLVTPSQWLRAVAGQVESLLPKAVPVVVCAKGIEVGTGALMTRVIAEAMPGRPCAVLSGPSFAEEVAAEQPTAVTIAAASPTSTAPGDLAERVAITLRTPTFRPYISHDPIGVEIGGAVKNVLAIACGIAAGRGLGSNTRAALMARGLAEMQRLTLALGGRRETLSGLAGIGDLALTCSSEQSRNFSFGKALGAGRAAADAAARPHVVVEGAVNARSITALAHRLGVEMPICEAVDDIVHHGHPVNQAIQRLLMRPIRAESESARPHPAATRQLPELLPT